MLLKSYMFEDLLEELAECSYLSGEYYAKVVHYTPELAKEILEYNKDTPRRGVGRSTATSYEGDMRTGRFGWPDSLMIFRADGTLDNGFHRLTACVASDEGFDAFSFVDDHGNFDLLNMDNNRVRTHAHNMQIQGRLNATALSSTVRLLCIVKDVYSGSKLTASEGRRWSHHDLQDELSRNPTLDAIVSKASTLRRSSDSAINGSALGAFLSLGFDAGYELDNMLEFFSRTIEGADLRRDSPELALSKWLGNEAAKGAKSGRTRISRIHYLAVYIKAWNALVDDRLISQLRYLDNEKFPRISKPKGF